MWHFRRMGMTRRSIYEETNVLFMLGAPLKSKPIPSLSVLRSSVRRGAKLFLFEKYMSLYSGLSYILQSCILPT